MLWVAWIIFDWDDEFADFRGGAQERAGLWCSVIPRLGFMIRRGLWWSGQLETAEALFAIIVRELRRAERDDRLGGH